MVQRRPDDERGDATIMVIILTTALLLIMGLVIDGSRLYQAQDQARWAAEQAARAAAQEIDASQVQAGDRPVIDRGKADAAARQALAAAGASGVMTPNGDEVTVSATVTTEPVFVGVFGASVLTGTGDATVRLARGIEDGNG